MLLKQSKKAKQSCKKNGWRPRPLYLSNEDQI